MKITVKEYVEKLIKDNSLSINHSSLDVLADKLAELSDCEIHLDVTLTSIAVLARNKIITRKHALDLANAHLLETTNASIV